MALCSEGDDYEEQLKGLEARLQRQIADNASDQAVARAELIQVQSELRSVRILLQGLSDQQGLKEYEASVSATLDHLGSMAQELGHRVDLVESDVARLRSEFDEHVRQEEAARASSGSATAAGPYVASTKLPWKKRHAPSMH